MSARPHRWARRQLSAGIGALAAVLLVAFPLRPLLADAEPDTVRLYYVQLDEAPAVGP